MIVRWFNGSTAAWCSRASTSRYLIASTRLFSSRNPIEQLERDGAPILRVVQRRIDERAASLSQMSDFMTSPEDIQRARLVKELEPLQNAWDEWNHTRQLLRETSTLLSDPDPSMRALAQEEYNTLASILENNINTVFPSLLVPPSRTEKLSALMELKSGVGGSEASLFLADLLRMYLRHATVMRWNATVMSSNESEGGGTKDAIVEFKGAGAYDALQWESGVHRVQRVPATEASGRVHTSTVAIIVLPLVEEEAAEGANDLYSMEDIRIEVMRARGAGGQHVNKTESAVRLTHIPTGITVSMQDERSQHQNRRRAFQVLSARLMDLKLTKEVAERRSVRQNLVRSADRSEKIRTYNYAQERVTDHRIGLTMRNLSSVMEGDGIQEFIDALRKHHEQAVMDDMLASTS